jgi:hypothetical protein
MQLLRTQGKHNKKAPSKDEITRIQFQPWKERMEMKDECLGRDHWNGTVGRRGHQRDFDELGMGGKKSSE